MVPNYAYGIDLGTSNIKIYSQADDSVLIEKNMIAIENKKNIFAYGNSAYEMYEKAPANIKISNPLSNGVIADINNMERLIRFFVSDISKGNIRPVSYTHLDVYKRQASGTDLIRPCGGGQRTGQLPDDGTAFQQYDRAFPGDKGADRKDRGRNVGGVPRILLYGAYVLKKCFPIIYTISDLWYDKMRVCGDGISVFFNFTDEGDIHRWLN